MTGMGVKREIGVWFWKETRSDPRISRIFVVLIIVLRSLLNINLLFKYTYFKNSENIDESNSINF